MVKSIEQEFLDNLNKLDLAEQEAYDAIILGLEQLKSKGEIDLIDKIINAVNCIKKSSCYKTMMLNEYYIESRTKIEGLQRSNQENETDKTFQK